MIVRAKRHFMRDRYISDDAQISIRYAERDEAVIYLMRKFLLDGWSVVYVGDDPHHYYGIGDIAPTAIRRFDIKALQEEIAFPWLKGIDYSGALLEEEILRTLMRLPYLTGDEPPVPNPNDRQVYYEICTKGSKKEKLFTEAFFAGILQQLCIEEPAQRMVIFIQAPYRPKTKQTEHILRQAIEKGLKIVYMHYGSGIGYKKARYSFGTRKDGKIYVDHRRYTYEIEDDTHVTTQK